MLNDYKEWTDRILRNGQNAESLQGVDRVLNHCREWMEYAECRWWVDYCRASVCVGGGGGGWKTTELVQGAGK